jgi:hypothetical protein
VNTDFPAFAEKENRTAARTAKEDSRCLILIRFDLSALKIALFAEENNCSGSFVDKQKEAS